jgi:hypothetical protein
MPALPVQASATNATSLEASCEWLIFMAAFFASTSPTAAALIPTAVGTVDFRHLLPGCGARRKTDHAYGAIMNANLRNIARSRPMAYELRTRDTTP